MDFSNMFSEGTSPSLEQVLAQREKRVSYINFLLNKHPDCSVISLKLNTPGPIKNNDYILQLFKLGEKRLSDFLDAEQILFSKNINPSTGPERFIVVGLLPLAVKTKMIEFEQSGFGRLFDADVMYEKDDVPQSVSRAQFDLSERKCFICDNDAKVCSSRRLHPVEELQKSFIKIVQGSL